MILKSAFKGSWIGTNVPFLSCRSDHQTPTSREIDLSLCQRVLAIKDHRMSKEVNIAISSRSIGTRRRVGRPLSVIYSKNHSHRNNQQFVNEA